MKKYVVRPGSFGSLLVLGLTACTVVTEPSDEQTSEETERPAADAGNTTGSDESTRDAGRGTGGTDSESLADISVVLDRPDAGSSTREEETSNGDAGQSTEYVSNCEDLDLSDAAIVSGTIREDVTWSGNVVVRGEARVYGGQVNIEPGTNVVFEIDSSLNFGWNNNSVTLFADGEEGRPVRFCGKSPGAGTWGFVEVGAQVTSNSRLRHVVIDGAGATSAALVLKSPVLVDHVRVSRAGGVAVSATSFANNSEKLIVSGAGQHAVTLTHPAAVHRFPSDSELTGNSEDSVHIAFNTITEVVTFRDVGVPYVQEGTSLQVRTGSNLRFEAGVEYLFTADASIEVGWNNSDVTLNVAGTETEPVVFRGLEAVSGYWHGVIVRANVRTNSAIHHLNVRHAGGDDNPALLVQAAVTVSDITLQDNSLGARVNAQGLASDSVRWTITGTDAEPVTILPDAWVTLPADSDFTGNAIDRISVLQGSYNRSGTVLNLGIPYWIRGEVRTTANTQLTIAPGTQFVMAADTKLNVGWNGAGAQILARGSSSEPIRFVGESETPGFWYGVEVGANVLSSSALDWVEIHHAGGGSSPAAALVLRTGISVTNSTFSDSSTWGILRRLADMNDYDASNSFADNPSGGVGTF